MWNKIFYNFYKRNQKKSFKKSFNHYQDISISDFSEDNFSFSSINEYRQNVIVHRCVNIIAEAASHVPWIILKKENNNLVRSPSHPAELLLKHPNPRQGGAELFTSVIANKLIYGNSFLLIIESDNVKELYVMNSQNIEAKIESGNLVGYLYNNSYKKDFFPIDPITQQSKILHIKNYNPNSSDYFGISSLKAAALSIALYNKALEWNNNLLKNGGRPTGALIVRDNVGYLSEKQFERLKEQLTEQYLGSKNVGKPLLLEGGIEWQEMSINPKDMDFIQTKNSAARDIALAFGVPPHLLGINGDSTYNNMQEARVALWEETIIPLLDKIADSLTTWFQYWYQEDIVVDFNRDAISALTHKQENLWAKINNANFMTINEKRAIVGLVPIESGDVLQN